MWTVILLGTTRYFELHVKPVEITDIKYTYHQIMKLKWTFLFLELISKNKAALIIVAEVGRVEYSKISSQRFGWTRIRDLFPYAIVERATCIKKLPTSIRIHSGRNLDTNFDYYSQKSFFYISKSHELFCIYFISLRIFCEILRFYIGKL